jgi:C1A family cysteine protease
MLEGGADAVAPFNFVHKATPVKRQYPCGSCGHHSAIEVYETVLAIHGKGLKAYSVQQLIDCVPHGAPWTNWGCKGSFPGQNLRWLSQHGAVPNAQYPYKASQGKCRKPNGPAPKLKGIVELSTFNTRPLNENSMISALKQYGPLSIVVDIHSHGEVWAHYSHGILPASHCSSRSGSATHAVTVFGYGVSGGQKYWLVRNHFGSSWGEKGYIRLQFGHNTCGVANWVIAAKF